MPSHVVRVGPDVDDCVYREEASVEGCGVAFVVLCWFGFVIACLRWTRRLRGVFTAALTFQRLGLATCQGEFRVARPN